MPSVLMVSDIDIRRVADQQISRFGRQAAVLSAVRAARHLSSGDIAGFMVWKRVVKAIEMVEDWPGGGRNGTPPH